MGKLSLFTISFSNPNGVFYAGTMIEGYVTIDLKDSMEMRGIHLTFEGKAQVHWTETESTGTGENSETRTVSYSASEKYFDQDVLLHGIWSSQGRSTTKLPQGRHTFPFQFLIPPNLPSSFEGTDGQIRYMIRCKIDKPWKFDHKTKRAFTIISILDLNSDARYSQRLQGVKEKRLCCLCCKSGPISVSFHVDRTGYVPGEVIRPTAEISNGSNRSINKSYVELRMVTKFYAEGSTRTSSTVVGRLTRPSISAHSEDIWSGEEAIVIPPLPPSFLLGCKIIDISYILQSVVLEFDNKTQPMDWSKCIVCQTENGKKKKLSCPAKSKRKDTGAGYKKFIKNIHLFEEAGCEELPEWIKSEAKDAETLAINEGKWHSAYFSRFSRTKADRLVERKRKRESDTFDKSIKTFTRVNSSNSHDPRGVTESTASTPGIFRRNMYFLCHEEGVQLHQVQTLELDRRLRDCVQDLQDQQLIAELNTASDLVAREAKYHANV
ncbi:arrestin domain-containing protein 3 [Elysia marginata]|uniref:Arrestin domain-containing protein 3 n=1 Tax=Elysia marginata TaxID=1093978 RepID=A0AAV4F307_9GAST|nr:arrestin domain-containing protein 3 [Elysia marginata]